MPAAANTYDVVLRPFRELVKLGELASSNSADEPDHECARPLKAAAKTLSNEGARALKKMTPLLLNPSPDFGEFLVGLALRNDDTAPRFKDIDVLLYDFEDYIEVDTFEKEKFDTLQSAIKDLAILLLEKIRTRQAESSLDDRPPPAAFPPLPPLPSTTPSASAPAPAAVPVAASKSPPPSLRRPMSRNRIPPVDAPLPPLPHDLVRRTSQPGDVPPSRPATFERASSYAEERRSGQLSPTSQAHLSVASASSMPAGMIQLDTTRSSIMSTGSNLPLSPESTYSQSTQFSTTSSAGSFSPYRGSVCTSVPETDYQQPHPHDFGELSPVLDKTMDAAINASYDTGDYHDHQYNNNHNHQPPPTQYQLRPMPDVVLRARGDTLAPANVANSRRTTMSDDAPSITDGHSDTTSTGYLISSTHSNGTTGNGSTRSRARADSTNTNTNRSSGVKTSDTSRASIRSGTSSGRGRRDSNTTAFGSGSSFGQLKGFCRGAQKFMAEGPGSAIKKVGGRSHNEGPVNKQDYAPDLLFSQMYSTQAGYQDEMAQCVSCEFKEIYSQLLQDMKQDPLANQQSHGMRYRSRFLYKSHVHSRDVHTTYFACLFCAQTGTTNRDDDATVFQSAALLFRHLGRHQLPLPQVSGVTVLYDAILDHNAPGAQDYDLHFPQPEVSNPLLQDDDDDDDDDMLVPSARAIKDHVTRRGQRPLDRPPILSANGLEKEEVLQFLSGARITQVRFPDKGDGKWCTGWHDGVFGAFPSMLIELELPRGFDPSSHSSTRSARSAVTKWKYEPKSSSSTPWLKLGRGDKITNIGWDDPRAWYWSGMTSKGKTGIFPKSHIRIETVRDGSQEESAPGRKKAPPKSGLSGLFSRS